MLLGYLFLYFLRVPKIDAMGQAHIVGAGGYEPLIYPVITEVTLLGDACHPMVPFMAQGACMAIEDGVVLSRALQDVHSDDIPSAFVRYENARKARTAKVQQGSRGNEWLKAGGNADWVYGYNAWEVSLDIE